MAIVSMKDLLEAGVHFGHRTQRWNPKMRPYIFTERSGIHIIDLQQTLKQIESAYELMRDTVAKGGTILFVGTKRQAQVAVEAEAIRAQMPYINLRWLGGTLTNWTTIKQRIDYLLQLERRWDNREFVNLTKKEQLSISRELEKLNRRLGGIKTLTKLPDALFVVDIHTESLAVKEATKLGIPIYGMVDTNSDPDPIRHVIPCNDDAIRSVKLLVHVIANGVEEGVRMREIDLADSGQNVSQEDLQGMEQYLGPSTIAKLRDEEEESESGSAPADTASTDATPQAEAPAAEAPTETVATEEVPVVEEAAAEVVAEASTESAADTTVATESAEPAVESPEAAEASSVEA